MHIVRYTATAPAERFAAKWHEDDPRAFVLESFWLQNTIRTTDSTGYGLDGGPKDSVDHHSYLLL